MRWLTLLLVVRTCAARSPHAFGRRQGQRVPLENTRLRGRARGSSRRGAPAASSSKWWELPEFRGGSTSFRGGSSKRLLRPPPRLRGGGRGGDRCGAVDAPVFGHIVRQTEAGVVFGCSRGHRLVGPKRKRCTHQGYWTPGTLPQCKVLIRRKNDGTYRHGDKGWTIGVSNVKR